MEDLTALWSGLTVDQVFRVSTASLLRQVVLWGWRLTLPAMRRPLGRVRGFVQTQPLRQLLLRAFGSRDGALPGIGRNLASGELDALAVTTTSYMTGQTIAFVEGREIEAWERPMRRGVRTHLRVEHVMASSALPLFFPAVRIGDDWHGDGGIRLHSPLAPAAHLGAGRILAVSTIHGPDGGGGRRAGGSRLPSAGSDPRHPLRRGVPRSPRSGCALAAPYEPRLPAPFRFLMRRLGTRETATSGLLSMVMFQPDYLTRLIELGEQDAAAQQDGLAALLGD